MRRWRSWPGCWRGFETMAKIYLRLIRAGYMTPEEVPERWRKAVLALLAEETE